MHFTTTGLPFMTCAKNKNLQVLTSISRCINRKIRITRLSIYLT